MSGPTTAVFSTPLGAVILAAEAIRQARAMGIEYEAVLAQTRERESLRQTERAAGRAAEQAGLAGLQSRVETLTQRVERLAAVCGTGSDLPQPPAGRGREAWAAHLRELEALAGSLEAQAAALGGQAVQAALAAIGDAPDLESVLNLYLARRQELQAESQMDAAAWRQTVERILARLELPAGEALPAGLEALARDIVLAGSRERAETLATELRLRVQLLRQSQAEARATAQEAAAWLEALPDEAPASLRAHLVEVAAGLAPLGAETRRDVQALLAAAAAERQRAEQEASAIVLEQSLKDLGYQVEPVAETLFAEGGMLHFQRPGWEGYYVRLRVNAREKTVNFNVVRARRESAVEEASSERQRQDFMAEERWCAEFPKLMQTLAARGLQLEVTRRLEAGELPVQAVAPEGLPDFASGETMRRTAGPRTMELPKN